MDVRPLKDERVLLTGATGFLGCHLARRLLASGARVYALLRKGTGRHRIADIIPMIEVVEGDLLDAESVGKAVERVAPSIVYHLAAFGVDRPLEDPGRAAAVNVVGTVHLLEALRRQPPQRFVYTGTCYEFSDCEGPVGPEMRPNPANLYAATKLAGGLMCDTYRRMYGMPAVVVRPFQCYGPWQGPRPLIPSIILRLSKGERVPLTSGRQIRDFVYVDDVIEGLLLAGTRTEAVGEAFHFGSGRGASVREVAELVQALMGLQDRLDFGALPHRAGEVWDLRADNTRATALLGWEPRTSLEDGLRRTIEWYGANARDIGQLEP